MISGTGAVRDLKVYVDPVILLKAELVCNSDEFTYAVFTKLQSERGLTGSCTY